MIEEFEKRGIMVREVNEEKTFNEFYDKYNKKVYNFVLYRIHNEVLAEEIMQDSFLTLYNMIEDMNEKSERELKNLVMAIAKNIVMSYSSKLKRRNDKFNENIVEFYEEKFVNPEDVIDDKETADEVYKALSKITKSQREAIIEVKLKGLSYKEAGKVLNKSEEEIKQLVYRAKKSLKKVLEKEYPDLITRYARTRKITTIIVLILSVTMLSGIVYASYKVYEHFIKKPETYTLEERDKAIDETSVNITKEDAKNKIKEYLDILKINYDYNLDDIKLIKDGIYDRTSWTLYIDDKFRIDIDANTGLIVKFNDLTTERIISEKKISTDDILKEIDECYKLLNLNKDYKVISYCENVKTDSKVLDVLYALEEDDIYNSIFVEYDIDSRKVISILHISYGEQDKKVNITKEEAIDILKEYDDVDNIDNVRINISQITNEKEVENISKEKFNDLDENLIVNEYEIKFYWEIIYNRDNKIKIDVETGKVIENGTLSVEEKED